MELTREHLLEDLTGLKASRRTYYREYREKERRLDRAIASIANISAALCDTTRGVPSLARAVVRVAAQHFDAHWAVISLHTDSPQRWVAIGDNGEAVVLDSDAVPTGIAAVIEQVIKQKRLVIAFATNSPVILGEPMFLRSQLVGELVVMPGDGFVLDEREISVLQTLANQAAVAYANAQLYEESERLRAEATSLCEEAVRQKTRLEDKNRQLEYARRRLAQARQNEVVNKERNRIARELHDNVAQHLISIGMNLEWCRAQLSEQSPVHDRICNAKELARSAITRIREAIFELAIIKPGSHGLVDALTELASDFSTQTHLQVQFQRSGELHPFPSDVEHALYHIAQEALFNAYKHAHAGVATVTLCVDSGMIEIDIIDDGIGIPDHYLDLDDQKHTTCETAHFGLRNMCERAREVGGNCTIMRCAGSGTVVHVAIPMHSLDRPVECRLSTAEASGRVPQSEGWIP